MNASRSRVVSRSIAPKISAPLKSGISSKALRLAIEYDDPASLKPAEKKIRMRGKNQLAQLETNIRCFGVLAPVLTNKQKRIIDGHGVVEVAKKIGLAEIPVICIEHLSDEQERICRIALNRIQEMSVWDPLELKSEFEFLSEIDIDLLSFTGFSTPEIDVILNPPPSKRTALETADLRPAQSDTIVTRLGDLWLFQGGHRLLCADALDPTSLIELMAGAIAQLVICDPPYNVPIRGHVSGRANMREFAMASGEMSRAEFTAFLTTLFTNAAAHSADGALNLHFIDWRHIQEMMAAGRTVYEELTNFCVWVKQNAGMGSLWRSQHELCFAWKKGTAPHINNVELGRHGRNRSNVWDYAGVTGTSAGAGAEQSDHPTPKSVAMIADAIQDVTKRGDIVLDPTLGSGTMLIAAHRTKRRGYGIEIDPAYVDMAVRRMETQTKSPARHAETGLTFAEMAAQYADEPASAQDTANVSCAGSLAVLV